VFAANILETVLVSFPRTALKKVSTVSPPDGVCADPIKVIPEKTSQVEIASSVVSEKQALIAFMRAS
jgi:hypothetical protein